MAKTEEEALEIVRSIAEKIKFNLKVENITYRDQYADFVVLLEDDFICMIRERLLDTVEMDKSGDVEREIELCLRRAEKYQDFDGEEVGPPPDQVIE